MPFGPVHVLLGNPYQNFLEASSCKQEHSSAGGPHASLLGPQLYSHHLPAPNDLLWPSIFSVKKCFLVLATSARIAEGIGDLKVSIYHSHKNWITLKIHCKFFQDGSGFPPPSALPCRAVPSSKFRPYMWMYSMLLFGRDDASLSLIPDCVWLVEMGGDGRDYSSTFKTALDD